VNQLGELLDEVGVEIELGHEGSVPWLAEFSLPAR
jgi:hypothetical protein